MNQKKCDIGLIGLAMMGQNLALNMNDHGYKVAVFHRTTAKVDGFLADQAKGTEAAGAHSIEELCSQLATPRRAMTMGSRVSSSTYCAQTERCSMPVGGSQMTSAARKQRKDQHLASTSAVLQRYSSLAI